MLWVQDCNIYKSMKSISIKIIFNYLFSEKTWIINMVIKVWKNRVQEYGRGHTCGSVQTCGRDQICDGYWHFPKSFYSLKFKLKTSLTNLANSTHQWIK